MLLEADRDHIARAVNQAEAATSAEIVCVLARRVSTYGETPIAWAAATALLAPPLLLMAGLDPHALPRLDSGWSAAPAAALPAALGAYALLQAVIFALVAAIVSLPALRVRLTPSPVKARRVREAALAQLAAASLAAGPARAAVVIFAADDEHRVEVLASESAHAAIGQPTWDQAVAAALDGLRRNDPTTGLASAVALCGGALAVHFPQTAPDANALPDRPLEL